jgi:hypothetical protein
LDGLDPDTARLWKEQVQGIVAVTDIGTVAAGAGGVEPQPAPRMGVTDCLTPLRDAIDQARYTMEAVVRELTNPEETVLRGFGKQLGSSKKDLIKNLTVGQPSGIATEATRLASEAGDAIKASRESIRAALREMGAASDISEASGPARLQPAAQERPAMGRLEPAVRRPTAPPPGGAQRPPPREWVAEPPFARSEWDDLRGPRRRLGAAAHAHDRNVAPGGVKAKASDRGGGRGVVGSDEGHDERPRK